jgi:hypothetical protein
VAHELRDDLLGFWRSRRRSGRGRWAWASRCCGRVDRAGPHACDGQEPRVAGCPRECLAKQGAHLLAYGMAQCSLESRIGGGEGLGQIP